MRGGLSCNKVSVGEPADGSPPKQKNNYESSCVFINFFGTIKFEIYSNQQTKIFTKGKVIEKMDQIGLALSASNRYFTN